MMMMMSNYQQMQQQQAKANEKAAAEAAAAQAQQQQQQQQQPPPPPPQLQQQQLDQQQLQQQLFAQLLQQQLAVQFPNQFGNPTSLPFPILPLAPSATSTTSNPSSTSTSPTNTPPAKSSSNNSSSSSRKENNFTAYSHDNESLGFDPFADNYVPFTPMDTDIGVSDDEDEENLDLSGYSAEEKSQLRAARKQRKMGREKTKRAKLNDQFDYLCRMLNMGKSTRVEKNTVLTETIRQMCKLRQENTHIRQRNDNIRKEIERKRALGELPPAKANAAPSRHQRFLAATNARAAAAKAANIRKARQQKAKAAAQAAQAARKEHQNELAQAQKKQAQQLKKQQQQKQQEQRQQQQQGKVFAFLPGNMNVRLEPYVQCDPVFKQEPAAMMQPVAQQEFSFMMCDKKNSGFGLHDDEDQNLTFAFEQEKPQFNADLDFAFAPADDSAHAALPNGFCLEQPAWGMMQPALQKMLLPALDDMDNIDMFLEDDSCEYLSV